MSDHLDHPAAAARWLIEKRGTVEARAYAAKCADPSTRTERGSAFWSSVVLHIDALPDKDAPRRGFAGKRPTSPRASKP